MALSIRFYLKDLAKRTFRGVEHLALNGLHTGGRVLGYRRVPLESSTEPGSHWRPVIAGVKLQVNDDGILSPQPQKGRISMSWCPSSVRHILRNERYRGVVIWGKTRKVRSPKGTRIYQRRPPSEWRRFEIPEQRIVSDELWNLTRGRIEIFMTAVRANGRGSAGPPTRPICSPVFCGAPFAMAA